VALFGGSVGFGGTGYCNDEHGVLDYLLPTGNTPKTVNTGELFISKQEDTFR
jgi:hypothetical protein